MNAKLIPEHTLDFSGLDPYLQSVSSWIGEALPHYLPRGEPQAELYDLVADYPSRGGKRFRPALLLLCASIGNGNAARALPSAVALELFQNFALVHDDIEDASLLRRGAPTLHRRYGLPLALNAGDLLFTLVHEALLTNEPLLGAVRTLEVQRRFAVAFRHTIEGQAMDIAWSQGNTIPDRAAYEVMICKKTGWYSGRVPCEIGVLIGSEDATLMEQVGSFGEKVGVGFQVRDDLLNLCIDSSGQAPQILGGGYGKEQGGDISEGKRTLIVIEMMERLPPAEGAELKRILLKAAEETSAEEVAWAIDRAEQCGAMAAVAEHCRLLGHQAVAMLDFLPDSPQKRLLCAMAEYLIATRSS